MSGSRLGVSQRFRLVMALMLASLGIVGYAVLCVRIRCLDLGLL